MNEQRELCLYMCFILGKVGIISTGDRSALDILLAYFRLGDGPVNVELARALVQEKLGYADE